jgi:hypothetical protein
MWKYKIYYSIRSRDVQSRCVLGELHLGRCGNCGVRIYCRKKVEYLCSYKKQLQGCCQYCLAGQ